ncbi:hypothetical protein AMECASPLE_005887 [Ameca splendens]|uniref:Uncharacterized protein n=1 Tax=Ameca splendens TaxID=208324 RepID=A0ABV0YAM1_9TELE
MGLVLTFIDGPSENQRLQEEGAGREQLPVIRVASSGQTGEGPAETMELQRSNIQLKTNFTRVRGPQFWALKSWSSLLPWRRQELLHKPQNVLQANCRASPSRQQVLSSLLLLPHQNL